MPDVGGIASPSSDGTVTVKTITEVPTGVPYDTFMKWSLEGDPDAHKFSISNAHKDMRYLASMANQIGAVNNIQTLVKNSFAAMEAAGQGDKFVPMLADFVAGLNGLPPAGQARR